MLAKTVIIKNVVNANQIIQIYVLHVRHQKNSQEMETVLM